MSDLLGILLMTTAFGGLGAIGLMVLVGGLFAARTSSVILCAIAATLLFAAQVGFYAFWQMFGDAWSGGGGRGATYVKWGAIACALLVAAFLAFKLPRTWGKPVTATHPLRDGARNAALLILVYVLYRVGLEVLRWAHPPGGGYPAPTLATWVTPLVGLALAWGLWRHARWAWFGAVAGTAYLAIRILWFASTAHSDMHHVIVVTPVGFSLFLLASILGVLLLSNARRLCWPSP